MKKSTRITAAFTGLALVVGTNIVSYYAGRSQSSEPAQVGIGDLTLVSRGAGYTDTGMPIVGPTLLPYVAIDQTGNVVSEIERMRHLLWVSQDIATDNPLVGTYIQSRMEGYGTRADQLKAFNDLTGLYGVLEAQTILNQLNIDELFSQKQLPSNKPVEDSSGMY